MNQNDEQKSETYLSQANEADSMMGLFDTEIGYRSREPATQGSHCCLPTSSPELNRLVYNSRKVFNFQKNYSKIPADKMKLMS